MYIPRLLSTKIKKLLTYFPAILLTGARQTGKTTLLTRLFPEYSYTSLDLPSHAEQAENNPDSFLAQYPSPVIIDEIQYAPELFRFLKSAIDAKRTEMGRFILTGSQKFNLMKHASDSLAGRCAIMELENLSFEEITQAKLIECERPNYPKVMVRGQFPELWRVQEFPLYAFYSSYVATYLERDVRQIVNVSNLRDFERFFRVLAARAGAMLNKSEIAKEVGVSIKAIGDWISVLQTSGQIILLEPWFTNINKRIVKTPKVYFADTGLLCFLLGLNADSLLSSPYLGVLWENFVFA
jgi:hypothetical protein